YALFPHMSVLDNVGYGLSVSGLPKAEIAERARAAMATVGLVGMDARLPGELSCGQQQREALARALVIEPAVLLFDEPLSNLDAKLRVAMRAEIKALHQRLKTTTVYVTHDQIEAMTMADRIVVMHDGIIEQIGTPLELFDRPGNLFVAQFIGSPAMNVLPGTLRRVDGPGAMRDVVEACGALWPLGATGAGQGQPGQAVHYGVRPSDLTLADSGIPARVVVVEPTGAETELLVEVGEPGGNAGARQQLTVVLHGRTEAQPGDVVHLAIDAPRTHLFDSGSGQRLN
ncbi:MAG: hypothetical protein RLY78_3254, partial [Pseudomonadota bacterium]